MTSFENLLANLTGTVDDSTYATWQRAQGLFDERRYDDAARLLETIVTDTRQESTTDDHAPSAATGHDAARLLLARAYFHSAQLTRAIETAQAIVENDPSETYARVLLSHALKRAGRTDEAAGHQRIAEAMGAA